MRTPLLTLLAALSLALAACNESSSTTRDSNAAPAPNPDPVAEPASWTAYERPADYPGTVTLAEEFIDVEGARLSVKATVPADGNGNAVAGPFPCILTQTGYNKNIPAIPAVNAYLVQRGYAHFSVDVRGTGNSTGSWEAFGEAEQLDYLHTIDWVAKHEHCNGSVGTWGASFMGITQLFTAAHRHPAHRAVFAIVPMADAYRDIVFSGGQVNVGFIPLWMGLVTGLGAIPTQNSFTDPAHYLSTTQEHVVSAVTSFQLPVILEAVLGSDLSPDGGDPVNYDGPFWRIRSPIEQAHKIEIPTFIVGGLNDIFQRGEPLLYESLKTHTTAKLLIGPWQHIEGSSGAGLPRDGVPSLDQIALRWFDHYLKGMDVAAADIPAVTQYLYGEERYVTASDWPHPQARAQRLYLRGDRSLSPLPGLPGEDSNVVLQQPANGICSTSTAQWTAGIIGLIPLPSCFTDNTLTETLEVTYTTAPMAQDFYINGPIQADLWIATTALDASVVVRVTDVPPGPLGSRELTNGILTASLRTVDPARSRFLDGEMIQPWHPFTAESVRPVGFNEVVPLNVEIFPTSAVIKAGHSLRISIGASDFPHGLPPVPDLADQAAGVLTIYSDAARPSSVVLPLVPVSAIAAAP